MLVPVKMVDGAFAPAAAAVAYTAPSTPNLQYRVNQATFSNSAGAAAITLTVYVVPSGATRGDEHVVGPKAKALAVGESITWHWLVGHHLGPGDTIDWVASAADKVAGRVSGVALPTN